MNSESMAPSMVERVAHALSGVVKWDEVIAGRQEHFRTLARAAIAAMRDNPTEEMLEAGPPEPYMDRDVWAKMVEAALKE